MPLELPNLDDRTYDDLVAEALSLIPTYAPEWTNHNPSDPGIMLIELFAYLTEMQLYRQNRITDANTRSFLKLLNGSKWEPSGEDAETLDLDLQKTISKLRKTERAVSRDDFVFLAKEADERVARAYCLPQRDLRMNFDTERAGYVGLIVIPQKKELLEAELPEIIAKVEDYLEPRRLLTTRLHVVGPQYLQIHVELIVVPLPDVLEMDLEKKVKESLVKFFDPLGGGKDQKGWIFGRSIFVSEICELVDQIPGVDSVSEVKLYRTECKEAELTRTKCNIPDRRIKTDVGSGIFVGLELKPYELVDAKEENIVVNIVKQRD
jgi:hypothetical protein